MIDLTLESSSDEDDDDDLIEEEPKSETPELVREDLFSPSSNMTPFGSSKGSVTPPIINLGTPEYVSSSYSPHLQLGGTSTISTAPGGPYNFFLDAASHQNSRSLHFDARNFLQSALISQPHSQHQNLPPLPYLPSLNHFDDEVLDLSDLEDLAIPY